MAHYYTGVGSRSTPPHILKVMYKIALVLDAKGYILRSGWADGADATFEIGSSCCDSWKAKDATEEAMEIASRFHPAWSACTDYAKKLHGRNVFQVLGRDLHTPSEFVICWTVCGATCHDDRKRETGGTGTAISVASHYNVPVYNLQRSPHMRKLKEKYLGQ